LSIKKTKKQKKRQNDSLLAQSLVESLEDIPVAEGSLLEVAIKKSNLKDKERKS
jgi:hypothetical protein